MLHTKQDIDELSEIVVKNTKKYTGFWIPLKEDAQGTFIWADGSPYDTSLAKRVITNIEKCQGPGCYFALAANNKNIVGTGGHGANVMCVMSNSTRNGNFEKSKKELESLETKIQTLRIQIAMHEFRFKQHVNQMFDIAKSTRESVEGIEETTKNLRKQLTSN